MKTVVFVMMVWTHSANWIPTIEFSDMNKCVASATAMKQQVDAKLALRPINLGQFPLPFCVEIQK